MSILKSILNDDVISIINEYCKMTLLEERVLKNLSEPYQRIFYIISDDFSTEFIERSLKGQFKILDCEHDPNLTLSLQIESWEVGKYLFNSNDKFIIKNAHMMSDTLISSIKEGQDHKEYESMVHDKKYYGIIIMISKKKYVFHSAHMF